MNTRNWETYRRAQRAYDAMEPPEYWDDSDCEHPREECWPRNDCTCGCEHCSELRAEYLDFKEDSNKDEKMLADLEKNR